MKGLIVLSILSLSATTYVPPVEHAVNADLSSLVPNMSLYNPDSIEVIPDIHPIDGSKIVSSFGWRRHPILDKVCMHKGIDYAAKIGTPVRSTAEGKVTFVCNGVYKDGRRSTYGKYIMIDHGEYSTLYAHLSKIHVIENQIVSIEVIGEVGNTGRSTGPHLHYEVRHKDKLINPIQIIDDTKEVLLL